MTKVYTRRIAFMISDQHLIPHGGIGSFFKGFVEMCRELNWKVDCIMDKAPNKDNLLVKSASDVSFIYPDPANQLPYSAHNATFALSGDGVNMEKSLNFRTSLMKAFETRAYDLVVINSPEAAMAPYFLNIQKYIPVVFYTHNENLIFYNLPPNDTFKESFTHFVRNFMELPGITVGTQSTRNAQLIAEGFPKANVHSLPMRLPERGLLEKSKGNRSGVLFVGRFEDRKNPKVFIDAVAKANLPAKVLTGGKNASEKWQQAFEKAGVKDYEIKVGVIGQEKVDFIKSARIAFHSAILESYGFSAFETLHSCPTVCLNEYEWWKNFEHLGIHHPSKKEVVDLLKELYESPWDEEAQLKTLQDWDKEIAQTWDTFLAGTLPTRTSVSRETDLIKSIRDEEQLTLNRFYKEIKKRNPIGIVDVESVLGKRAEIYFHHTDDHTYVSLSEKFKEPEEDSLFSF